MKNIPALLILASSATSVIADSINWGSAFGSTNVQSDGATPVTAGFTIQLGKFASGFVPDGANVDLWAANWTVFDSLQPGQHNAAAGYFTRETTILNNTTFQAGDRAYVWMFNSQTVVPGSEWLLYTNDSSDGVATDDWLFPTVSGSQQTTPLSWRVSNASNAVFGCLDPDGIGAQPADDGSGYGTVPATAFNLQTKTFVPEPASGLLAGLSALVLMRRRRPGTRASVALATAAAMASSAGIAGAVPYTYETVPVPALAVPDNNAAGVNRTFSVTDEFNIVDLNVGFNLTHGNRGDIRLRLTSPMGTTVTLINGASGDADNNYDILLDSASAAAIDDNSADNVGTVYYDRTAGPNNSLNAFNGQNASGVWTVNIADITGGNSGTVNRISLNFDGNSTALNVRVFDDLYWDGIWQNGVDPSLNGVTVRAFDQSGANAVLTANGDGTYSLALGVLTGTRIRYEVDASTLPAGYYAGLIHSGPGSNAAPLVGSVSISPGPVFVNVAVQKPKVECPTGADQDLFTTCFIGGPRDSRTPVNTFNGESEPFIPADAPAVVAFPRAAAGTAPATQNRYLATIGMVGTTYGVAPQAAHSRVYVGAFGKRHADTGPGGNGAIYAVDTGGGGVLTTFTIPNAGTTAHGIDATNSANNGLLDGWLRDSNWYDRVGKEALGDVEINPSGTRIWTVNLNDKHLYTVDVANPAGGTYGTVTDLGPVTATTECVGGEQNWRPFALCWNGSHLYLGGTCTGETSNSIDDVSVLIYRLNNPTVDASKTLIYDSRLSSTDGGFKYGRGDTLIAWNPWRTTWNSTVFKSRSGFATIYPQPWLVDFSFDNNNRLVLGIRDRFGDQIGIYTRNPGLGGTGDLASTTTFYETVTMGEILMAEWNPVSGATGVATALPGDWRSEIAAGFSLPRQDDPNDAVAASEFFWRTSYTDIHPETGQGAVAFNPLFPNEVAVVAQDPFSLRSGGVQFFSTNDGSSAFQNGSGAGGYRVYQGQPVQGQLGLFGKANGLGDLEYGCGTTVQQIGDIVWYDEDRDGVRDPAEVPVAGVTVRLYADNDNNGVMDDRTGDGQPDPYETTLTDAGGRWLFGSRPNTAVRITFDRSTVAPFNDSSSNPVTVANLQPTRFHSALSGGNAGNDSDLNGLFAGLPVIAFTTGAIGISDHSLDAGLQSCQPITLSSVPALLPGGTIGTPYTASFLASGGVAPYTFTVSSGALPDGLTLSAAGEISGTPVGPPAVAGFTVLATDSTGCTGTASFSIGVNCPVLTLSPDTLANGTVGFAYGPVDFTQTGGSGTITWSLDSGTLPPGLAINGGTGRLDGIPTAPGSFSFAIRATDSFGCTGAVNLTMNVLCNTLIVSPSSLADGAVGAAYGPVTFSQTGATGGVTWSLSAGSLPSGLTFNPATAELSGTPTAVGSSSFTITATDGNNCFGSVSLMLNVPGGAITGTVQADTNNDNAGDAPLSGVRVDLCSASSGLPVDDPNTPGSQDYTVRTAADGSYAFVNLPPGAYLVKEVQPGGWLTVTDSDSTDPADDPANGSGTDDLLPVTIADGETDSGNDFVEEQPARIGNLVWLDENSDGFQDEGERGIANVAVLLCDATGSVQLAETVTDTAGGYAFSVAPGSYRVKVSGATLPAGFSQTPVYPQPGSDLVNQNHDGPSGYALTVGPGGENLTADFGYNANPAGDVDNGLNTAALGDRVWIDTDADGRQDPDEPGLAGVTLQLCSVGTDGIPGSPDDVPGPSAVTDAAGIYLFDGLAPDAYIVKVASGVPPTFVQSGDPDHFGGPGLANDGVTTAPVILGPGDVFLNSDFGYVPPPAESNCAGDSVWLDANADGVRDPGEYGIGGVTLALVRDLNGSGAWDAGEPVVSATTTDASGYYVFCGLPDGRYLVRVTDTANVLNTLVQTYDSNGLASPGISAADLDSAGVSTLSVFDQNQDFGYTPPQRAPLAGAIGDRVWLDSNGDGVQDSGEPGLEGLTVTLCDASGSVVYASAVTDENGRYWFAGLDLTAWQVKVTPPAGLMATFDADGTGTPNVSTATLTSGVPVRYDQDFGYQAAVPGIIGNLVWLDANADGISDPDGADDIAGNDDDEPGIAGVTLDLYRDTNNNCRLDPGEGLVASAVTGTAGDYQFTGLATDDGSGDSAYIVDVSDRAGILAGHWQTLGTPGLDDNGQQDPYCVLLTPGAPSNPRADFGYRLEPAALGNYVWHDVDWSGSQSAGDLPLPGVRVTLTIEYPNGAVTTVGTVTDGSGHYRFDNLLSDEDDPCASLPGPGASHPVFTISVASGQVPGMVATFPDSPGAGDWLDADNPAGVTAMTCQGLTDVQAVDPANLEAGIASYDFGFRTGKPLTWQAFVNAGALTAGDELPGANPDGDIYPNILEYAFCLPPRSGTPLTPHGDPSFCLLQAVGGSFNASITRPAGAAGLIYTLEYADTLGTPTNWIADETITPSLVNNGDGTETLTWPDLEQIPELAAGRGFVRVVVLLDTNADDDPDYSAATYVLGWRDHAIATQCETCSNPFLGKDVFSGTVTSTGPAHILDVSGSASGSNIAAVLAGRDCLFVEVISGPMVGQRFGVNAAGSGPASIALDPASPLNTASPIPDLTGSPFVVRKAWQFSDLFPAGTFLAAGDVSTADNILTFDAGTQAWKTYFLADLGAFGIRWVDASDGPGLPGSQDGRCLDPGQGVFVHRRGAPLTVPQFGVVRENDFATPLAAGYTLTAGGYPLDQSYETRGMSLANGFVGSTDIRMADQVLFWAGDETPGHVCYVSDYLLDAGPPWQRWVRADDNFVNPRDSEFLFRAGRAAFICRGVPLPGYVVAAPWSP